MDLGMIRRGRMDANIPARLVRDGPAMKKG